MKEDKLGFIGNFKVKTHTKRGMLSIASSIYDPLGLFSPFVLEGRQIIQIFCLNQLAWDNPVGEDIQQKCSKQKLSLNKLQEIKLNRCYKLNGFGKVASCSLHDFFDASKSGYWQVTYLRLVSTAAKVHCSLLIPKSRVAPMKYISIPRLQLTAAVSSTKMSGLVKKELGIDYIAEYYCTDTQVVIGILVIPRRDLRYL